jgi:hypothetical protein
MTYPPRSIMPNTGGLSFWAVPRPRSPFKRRLRPSRPRLATCWGCPLCPATLHSLGVERLFFSHNTLSKLLSHGLYVIFIQPEFSPDLLIGKVQAHEI